MAFPPWISATLIAAVLCVPTAKAIEPTAIASAPSPATAPAEALAARVQGILADLDHESFQRREGAVQSILKLPPEAAPMLDEWLARKDLSVEARARAKPAIEEHARRSVGVRYRAAQAGFAKQFRTQALAGITTHGLQGKELEAATRFVNCLTPEPEAMHVVSPARRAELLKAADAIADSSEPFLALQALLVKAKFSRDIDESLKPEIRTRTAAMLASKHSPTLRFICVINAAYTICTLLSPDGLTPPERTQIKEWTQAAVQFLVQATAESKEPLFGLDDVAIDFLEVAKFIYTTHRDLTRFFLEPLARDLPTSHIPPLLTGTHCGHLQVNYRADDGERAAAIIDEYRKKTIDSYKAALAIQPLCFRAVADPIGLSTSKEEMEDRYRIACGMVEDSRLPHFRKAYWLYLHEPDAAFEFLRAIAERYDPLTGIPLLLPDMHATRGTHKGAPNDEYFARPEVWDDIQTVYTKFLAKYKDDCTIRTKYFLYACYAQQWQIANEQLQTLGDNIDKQVITAESLAYYRRKIRKSLAK